MKTRTLLLATVSSLAMTGSGSAADLPLKAPPIAVPVASWAGPYIGAHLGVGRLNQFTQAGATSMPACGVDPGDTCATSATGVIGGLQAGYNWQARYFVYGVEVDWSWTGINRTTSIATASSGTITNHTKMNWVASLRGRMGLALDDTLVYVTGGVAAARPRGSINTAEGYVYGFDKTAWGWVAGLGVEHILAMNPRWSVKGEFLYYDLGRNTISQTSCISGGCGGSYTGDWHHELFVARVGLNYRF